MSTINLHKLSITVIINVLLISIFIGLFFFTYGAYIEKKVVKNQIEFFGNNISSLIKLCGSNVNNYFSNFLKKLTIPDLSHEDKIVADSNKKVLMKALIANIFFILLVVTSIFFIYRSSKKDFSIKTLLIQNMILLLFIGFTEFSFLTFFGSKYISINPNFIKLKVVENIEELLHDKISNIENKIIHH